MISSTGSSAVEISCIFSSSTISFVSMLSTKNGSESTALSTVSNSYGSSTKSSVSGFSIDGSISVIFSSSTVGSILGSSCFLLRPNNDAQNPPFLFSSAIKCSLNCNPIKMSFILAKNRLN